MTSTDDDCVLCASGYLLHYLFRISLACHDSFEHNSVDGVVQISHAYQEYLFALCSTPTIHRSF